MSAHSVFRILGILKGLMLIAFSSCQTKLHLKTIENEDVLVETGQTKLRLKTIENEDILVENYHISEITTIHQFVSITNKRWNKTQIILEANENTVDSIFIINDTLFLRLSALEPTIYDLSSVKFGYKIVLSSPK